MSIADKLTTIAENQEKVYDAGKAEGKDAEWNLFWDALQANGTRTTYSYVFSGAGWTKEAFRPKYDMKPTGVYRMFAACGVVGDLVEILEDLGVELDFSQATSDTNYLFSGAKFTRVGVINTTSMYSVAQTFMSMYNLVTIDKLVLKDDGSQSFALPFSGCSALENLTIEGKIGKNGLSFQWSTKLSRESITSVVNALSDATSGLTVTISKTAKESAFTDEEWATLVATKPNWTITLA